MGVRKEGEEKSQVMEGYFRCCGFGEQKQHYVMYSEMAKDKNMVFGVNTICKACKRHCGNKRSKNCTPAQNASKVFGSMKNNSSAAKRNHEFDLTKEEVTTAFLQQQNYCAGHLVFPMTQLPGFHNACSPDRFNDSVGYRDNFRFRPNFLNARFSFGEDDLLRIDGSDVRLTTDEEHKSIANAIEQGLKRPQAGSGIGKLYSIADNVQQRIKNRRHKLLGNGVPFTIPEYRDNIVWMLLEQGFRCRYTNVILTYAIDKSSFACSIERVDPMYEYGTEGNDAIICSGLNGQPCGQCNEYQTPEARKIASDNGRFSQQYWDEVYSVDAARKELQRKARDQTREGVCKYLNEKFLRFLS